MKFFTFCFASIIISELLFSSCNSTVKNKGNKKDTTIRAAAHEVAGSFDDFSGITFDSGAIQKFLKEKPLFKEFARDFDNF